MNEYAIRSKNYGNLDGSKLLKMFFVSIQEALLSMTIAREHSVFIAFSDLNRVYSFNDSNLIVIHLYFQCSLHISRHRKDKDNYSTYNAKKG